MLAPKLFILLLPLLHNAEAQSGKFSGQAAIITAPPELSTPRAANSLDIARRVPVGFPSGVYDLTRRPERYETSTYSYPSGWLNKHTYPPNTNQPTNIYSTTPCSNCSPSCWSTTTTTAKPPSTTTKRYTYEPPTTPCNCPSSCWTATTPTTTVKQFIYTTPRVTYRPPTTRSTPPYIPPCWKTTTSTTTVKPNTSTTPCYTYQPPTTRTTPPYIPPCWTATTPTTTVRPYISTTSQPPTRSTPCNCPPSCWQTTTSTTTVKPVTSTTSQPPTRSTPCNCSPSCWTTMTSPTTRSPWTTKIPKIITSTSPPQYNVCQDRNQYYPVPNEHTAYIECKDYVPTKHICPLGLIFKPNTIWPAYPCLSPSECNCTHGHGYNSENSYRYY